MTAIFTTVTNMSLQRYNTMAISPSNYKALFSLSKHQNYDGFIGDVFKRAEIYTIYVRGRWPSGFFLHMQKFGQDILTIRI